MATENKPMPIELKIVPSKKRGYNERLTPIDYYNRGYQSGLIVGLRIGMGLKILGKKTSKTT